MTPDIPFSRDEVRNINPGMYGSIILSMWSLQYKYGDRSFTKTDLVFDKQLLKIINPQLPRYTHYIQTLLRVHWVYEVFEHFVEDKYSPIRYKINPSIRISEEEAFIEAL